MNSTTIANLLRARESRRRWKNRFVLSLMSILALIAVIPLFIIFSYLLYRGLPGLSIGFFTEAPKAIGEVGGGMNNAIVGSAIMVLLSVVLGIPWGVAIGVYLSEYRLGWTNKFLRMAVDLLTSVPSIVVGLFVYAVLVVPLKNYSAIAGAFALTIIQVPIIARTTEEVLKLMPLHVREAGLALGVPRWKVLTRIVIPGSISGIATGVLLAIARISGETAPLLFTALSNNYGFRGLLQPTASLPVQIFNFSISHDDTWRNLAWTGALVLVLGIFLINGTTRVWLGSRGSNRGQ